MEIRLDAISENISKTLDVFDDSSFDKIKSTYTPEKTRGLTRFNLHRAQAHPLAVLIHNIQQETEKSKIEGRFAFSEESMFFIDTIANLRNVSNPTEILAVLRHIQNPKQAFSSLFEGRVFADYRNREMNILPVPEAAEQGVKTTDFIVECNKNAIAIECKSLEDKIKYESMLWEQIEGRIVKALGRHQRCWLVSIDAYRSILGKDVTEVINLALNKITKNDLTAVCTSDNKVSLNFQQICEPNVWYDCPLNLTDKRERVWFEIEYRTGPHNREQYYNPAGATINPYQKIDDFKRISRCISSAHKQIPKEFPGIVHIELPYKDGSRLLDVTDPIFNRIFHNLKKTPKINAAVFSARISQISTEPPDYSVSPFAVIIPNPQPKNCLPPEFELPFTSKDNPHSIQGHGEGTIVTEIDLHQPLIEQSGKYLFEHISIHGYPQIKVWQSHHGIFRVDVVDLAFGKYVFETDLNTFVEKNFKFAMGWSQEGIRCAANGKMLEDTYNARVQGNLKTGSRLSPE